MRCTTADLPAPYACLRWGWTFRPHEGCYYDNWHRHELAAYATSDSTPWQWIVFAGTSKLRGAFLSAVDHLVKSNPGDFSGIEKCWGRMDVQIGHLKLTYLDFRFHAFANYPLPSEKQQMFTCHGDNIALHVSEGIHNSTACIHNLLASEKPPTALVLDWERTGAKVLNGILDLPESWQGHLISVNFRSQLNYPIDAPLISEQERADIRETLGRPLHFIDTHDIGTPWLLFMEVSNRWYLDKL